jgi:hypothetical protein
MQGFYVPFGPARRLCLVSRMLSLLSLSIPIPCTRFSHLLSKSDFLQLHSDYWRRQQNCCIVQSSRIEAFKEEDTASSIRYGFAELLSRLGARGAIPRSLAVKRRLLFLADWKRLRLLGWLSVQALRAIVGAAEKLVS